MRNKIYI